MIKDPDEGASKRSLQVMIKLYQKRIWNDENTVNVIAEACLHQKTKICVAAVKFFIVANYDDNSSESDSDGSSEDEAQKIINQKGHVGSKMTRKKKTNLKKAMKMLERKDKRRSKVTYNKDFLPIDVIRNPQDFGDRLFTRLKRSNERFEVKLAIMKLLA